jgi:hypothetical protein
MTTDEQENSKTLAQKLKILLEGTPRFGKGELWFHCVLNKPYVNSDYVWSYIKTPVFIVAPSTSYIVSIPDQQGRYI